MRWVTLLAGLTFAFGLVFAVYSGCHEKYHGPSPTTIQTQTSP